MLVLDSEAKEGQSGREKGTESRGRVKERASSNEKLTPAIPPGLTMGSKRVLTRVAWLRMKKAWVVRGRARRVRRKVFDEVKNMLLSRELDPERRSNGTTRRG